MKIKFKAAESGEGTSLYDILPRMREGVPFEYESSSEAKRFTTYPLPELGSGPREEGWVETDEYHVRLDDLDSWRGMVRWLSFRSTPGQGFMLEELAPLDAKVVRFVKAKSD